MTPFHSPRTVATRAEEIFRKHRLEIFRQTDRLFAGLLAFQALAAIIVAIWISPRTWAGQTSQTHVHVWAALFLGAGIISLPIALAVLRPGRTSTRHIIAIAQMWMGGLLIHLTGGRIETHFHIFGSLAFLAFYRDWRVLITASAVVVVDHFTRGLFWPQSIFGVLTASWWRWLEHAGWVVFEDVFLMHACWLSVMEMHAIANRQAEVEAINAGIEQEIADRTGQLRESESRMRAIFNSAVDSIITMDPGGRIDSINAAAEQLFGYRADEIVGKNIKLLMPPPDQEQRNGELADYLKYGVKKTNAIGSEAQGRRKDGSIFPLDLSVSEFVVNGMGMLLGIVRDISKRKRAEQSLQGAAEAADAANRAKSEFLANMSHEIRTPMNGILGMTNLALDTELTTDQREYLDSVQTSAEALLTVINDILDFSKIEAGRLDLEEIEFSLRETVCGIMKTLALGAHERKHLMSVSCSLPFKIPASAFPPASCRPSSTHLRRPMAPPRADTAALVLA